MLREFRTEQRRHRLLQRRLASRHRRRLPAIYGFGHAVDVLLATGPGTYAAAVSYIVDDSPGSIVGADFTGDGLVDLVTTNAGYERDPEPSLSLLVGKGDGTFAAEKRFTHSFIDLPAAVVAADLDSDGDLDLLVPNARGSSVSVFMNDGNGNFAPQVRYGLWQYITDFAYTDVTGDGVPDLVGAVAMQYTIRSFIAVVPGLPASESCRADCNKDGKLNINDFICLQNEWRRRTPYGDYDQSASYTVNDFIAFQADFVRGCR